MAEKPKMLVRRECVDGVHTVVGMPVRDEVFELGTSREKDDCFIWTEVDRCVLNLHSKRVLGAKVTFRDCEIVAMKVVRDMNWRGVLFEHCAFRGTFRLLDFGIADPFSDHPAGLIGCDLSKARFDYCSFGHFDPNEICWPESPHVIFFHPGSHREAIHAIVAEWPMQGLLQMTALNDHQVHAVAQSLQFLQHEKCPAEQLERFLNACRTLDFVRINF
jgi:hypothetical protein